MKALFVAHNTSISGANLSFLSVIKGISSSIKIVVLVNDNKGGLIDRLNELGIEYICFRYDWWFAHRRNNICKQIARLMIDGKNYLLSNKSNKMIRTIRSYNFDVIYSNTSTIDIGAYIARSLGIPHIWHIREFGQEDFGFIPLVSENRMRLAFNEAYKLILISKALSKKYESIVPPEKVTVIYNGLDVDKLLSKGKIPFANGNINILITGQVCNAKRQDVAVRAVSKVREKGYPAVLFVAGNIDHSYIDPVLKKYPDNADWVKMLGSVSNIYELRNIIDIELVCSKSEAFGRVTLEAMLHSVPVIASNCGANPELIRHEETGLLYAFENDEDLSNSIIRLIEDKKLYSRIVSRAMEFAKNFTVENNSKAVQEVIEGALNVNAKVN